MNRRRTVLGLGRTVAALCLAATVTVVLAGQPASGAFSATTGATGGTVGSAASFCTATPTTLYSSGDSWTNEAAASDNHQNDVELRVQSASAGDRHIWTGFALPTVPARCDLTQAKLRYYNKTPVSGRNIDVYRGDPTDPVWTAATITWNTEPDYVGTAVSNAATTTVPGWQEWIVTAHVLAQYTGGNNGFLLRDRAENSATPREQVYYDRQNTTYTPTLVLTWG